VCSRKKRSDENLKSWLRRGTVSDEYEKRRLKIVIAVSDGKAKNTHTSEIATLNANIEGECSVYFEAHKK